jgi:hypothetical protein
LRAFSFFPAFLTRLLPRQLHLQALNQARSAFVLFRFSKSFFSSLEPGAGVAKVAVSVKSCVAVFRAANSVESCVVSLESASTVLSFVLRCKVRLEGSGLPMRDVRKRDVEW